MLDFRVHLALNNSKQSCLRHWAGSPNKCHTPTAMPRNSSGRKVNPKSPPLCLKMLFDFGQNLQLQDDCDEY